ncbi:MAG: EscN/YscN/HrcN family type III secretion system ATPase [Armatimonadetes bacterium]|nr:EscN/YscN/HrcN family type III secretion system ATPase [Armatimonadota bacterium]
MRTASEVAARRAAMRARLAAVRCVRPRGVLVSLSGWLARTGPMLVQPNEGVLVQGLRRGWHPALAVAADAEGTQLLLLDGLTDVRPGLQAEGLGEVLSVPAGRELLGRVLDPLGRPLDDGPLPVCQSARPVFAAAPALTRRRGTPKPFWTGVRALDAFFVSARGQRLGILGPAGTGKTTLLHMIARGCQADVIVLALVGERGREVVEAADVLSGKPAILIATQPQDPPGLRFLTALSATAIAEHFRDAGLNVLLAVDSLTRLAYAQREIGLAMGELPATRGYPPSVFGLLPQLVERAGPAGDGSITAFYTILTEAEDVVDPVAEVAMASLDGQVVLSRRLANEALYPAVDLVRSLSRLMPTVVDADHQAAAVELRRLAQVQEQAQDLLDVGLHRPGANPALDRAMRVLPAVKDFVAQPAAELAAPAATRDRLLALAAQP